MSLPEERYSSKIQSREQNLYRSPFPFVSFFFVVSQLVSESLVLEVFNLELASKKHSKGYLRNQTNKLETQKRLVFY